MSVKIVFGAMAVAAIGVGCSSTKFAYDNASIFVIPMIHDVTDFRSEQKEMISAKFREYMKTHRKRVLPQYVKVLNTAIASVDEKATVQSARRLRLEVMNALYATLEPGVEPAADLLMTLAPEQIDEMEKRYRKKIEKERKKRLSGTPEEIAERRAKRFVDLFENWAGDPSREQERTLKELNKKLPHATEAWFRHRDQKNAELFALLRSQPKRVKVVRFLKDWWLHPPRPKDPQVRKEIEAFLAATDEFIVRVRETLTPEQKERLKKKLAKFEKDFREIHEEPSK